MNTTKSVFFPLLLFLGLMTVSCNNKPLRDLVSVTTSAVPDNPPVSRVLEIVNVLEQAQTLDSIQQCRAARDIYCDMLGMVWKGCNDSYVSNFCKTVKNAFYGGSFPDFGMRVCMNVASDQCRDLLPHKQKLHSLCLGLHNQCR